MPARSQWVARYYLPPSVCRQGNEVADAPLKACGLILPSGMVFFWALSCLKDNPRTIIPLCCLRDTFSTADKVVS